MMAHCLSQLPSDILLEKNIEVVALFSGIPVVVNMGEISSCMFSMPYLAEIKGIFDETVA